jgi:hypothetical protein
VTRELDLLLLNITYKIFLKAFQLWLQSILKEVISLDYMAFLRLKYIIDIVFFTHERLDWARCSKQDLVFLKIDFVKTYEKLL